MYKISTRSSTWLVNGFYFRIVNDWPSKNMLANAFATTSMVYGLGNVNQTCITIQNSFRRVHMYSFNTLIITQQLMGSDLWFKYCLLYNHRLFPPEHILAYSIENNYIKVGEGHIPRTKQLTFLIIAPQHHKWKHACHCTRNLTY